MTRLVKSKTQPRLCLSGFLPLALGLRKAEGKGQKGGEA